MTSINIQAIQATTATPEMPMILTTQVKAKKLQKALNELGDKYPGEIGLFLANQFFQVWFSEELE
ncbi:hypothetical protein PQ469_05885 [Mucilaginibacter sp. KACC 22773]|uniref:hypothetical protein n=1 Tax=Mucilaginibacter sp. KACC 22773 TaxID=3025671 RepID=UPI00236551A7|nr:hypothetical protein [Mucilaginibacter sp. KACC 22773]WDF79532.1 hypothetical protein PQ469_05885 [Mucilaginibacter sp. KACC 22773]